MFHYCRRTFNSVSTRLFATWATIAICSPIFAAAPPVVEFDVAHTTSFRGVDSPECAKKRPHANIVEAVFEISTRLTAGKEEDLKYITYEIMSPDHQVSIAGFLPMTTMISESADGVINFEEHRSPAQLNIEYAGSQAKIQAPLRTPTDTKISIKKLAPKSLVMSSGTIDRARGVYFTLHPSEQDSLQRAHQFVCYFETPSNFRCDYVHISCVAVARDQVFGQSTGRSRPVGLAKFNVGIYRDGDVEAKQAVDDCAIAQQQLNNAVAAYHATASSKSSSKSELSRSADVFKSVLHVVRKEPTSAERPKQRSPGEGKARNDEESATQQARDSLVEAQRALEVARRTLRGLNGVETKSAS